jgi:hypothetical protein
MDKVSVQGLLEVLAAFDEHGGANPGLVGWELFLDEPAVTDAWEHALAQGWLRRAGRDPADHEQLWKLTLRGWAAVRERSPGSSPDPEAPEKPPSSPLPRRPGSSRGRAGRSS